MIGGPLRTKIISPEGLPLTKKRKTCTLHRPILYMSLLVGVFHYFCGWLPQLSQVYVAGVLGQVRFEPLGRQRGATKIRGVQRQSACGGA